MSPAAAVKPQAPPPRRMSLAAVKKGRLQQPLRVLLFGVEGIGKSTFGSNAPKPIFLGAEDGTSELDVERFPTPESWGDVLDALRTLTEEAHDYKTLVLDTLDWAEPLLWKYICERDEKTNLEAYGYGKGANAAVDEWRVFLAALERLRRAKPMHLVLLAHSWIKPFKNPEGEDFDRYELKMDRKAGGLLKEWCDCVLFANYETFATKDKTTKRVRGVSTGARLLYTERRAAYDAKNRYGLPEQLPLSWPDFEAAVTAHRPADPEALRGEIVRKLKQLGGQFEKDGLAWLEGAKGDALKLAQFNDRINFKLAEQAEKEQVA